MKGSQISRLPTALVLAALMGAATPAAITPALAASPTSDATFLQDAVRTDSTDAQIGQLAVQKSSSAGVQKLGQMLIDDHAAAGPEATRLANTLNVSLPIDQAPDQQATYNALVGLSGDAFDNAFIEAVIQTKQAAIAQYRAQAQSGDGEVAAYAEKTLPDLEDQLRMARMLKIRGTEHGTP